MQCKNLKFKTKKRIKYLYCNLLKKEITFHNCKNCTHKEYKSYNHAPHKKYNIKTIEGKKHKLTKATSISMKVKKIVWERDNHECIFCHKKVSLFYANSHYIKRGQLGLGIPENIMTNCQRCHTLYEESIYREKMKQAAKKHFISKYSYWNEDMLIYKKYQ